MNFYLNAITVTEKNGKVKVLQQPKIVFATSQKEVEYMSLKGIPKKYAKKLGNVNIYVQQMFVYNSYNYGTYTSPLTYGALNSASGNTTFTTNYDTGGIITADKVSGAV